LAALLRSIIIMPVSLPRRSRGGPARRRGGRDGGRGRGGRGGPLPSRERPKAPPPSPTMSRRDKQADLPLSRGRGAMIEARRPLLVFSRVSSTMMRPSSSSSLSALAAKTGAGGKKLPLPPMPPPPPTGGRDTPEIEEFRRRCPDCDVYVDRAARDGSTDAGGRRRCGSPVDNDDDDDGGDDDDCGGAAEMPDGVGDEFEAPLERGEAEFGSSGVAASPPLGSGSAGGGGSRNANDGAGRSSRSRRGKNRRGHRRRGGRTSRLRARSGIGVLSGGRRRTRKMTATVRERGTMRRER
jgi:hypothetical protein